MRKDKVVILAESAELPGDIDIGDRAQSAKERAEDVLVTNVMKLIIRRAAAPLYRER